VCMCVFLFERERVRGTERVRAHVFARESKRQSVSARMHTQ
jgi:hypothetical protein